MLSLPDSSASTPSFASILDQGISPAVGAHRATAELVLVESSYSKSQLCPPSTESQASLPTCSPGSDLGCSLAGTSPQKTEACAALHQLNSTSSSDAVSQIQGLPEEAGQFVRSSG